MHADPDVGLDIELRPAVISRYGPIVLISRQWKTNFEARRNSGSSDHTDKQGVEMSAVAALGGASPYRIAVSPTGAGLIVAHGGDDVVVDCARFRDWVLDSTCLLRRKFRDGPLKRHAAVWLEEALKICRGRPRSWTDSVCIERYLVFVAGYPQAYAHPYTLGNLFSGDPQTTQ